MKLQVTAVYPSSLTVNNAASIVLRIQGIAAGDAGNGGSGIDYSTHQTIAGETLSGGRVVYINGGKAFYFNPANTSLYGKALGITKGAALQDDQAYIQMLGVMNWPDNNLTPGAVYYAGVNGALTTNPAGLTVLQRVGHAIATNKLKLSFDLNIITI
ncbi:MAG TPA: hypothetical protein VEB42_02325 [Chitinophagaceae bacterium]|nr:hypothetical protein [Chitinophagaceae bacterium]